MNSTRSPCPACGSEYTRPWLAKNGYEHLRCTACGHGFVFPIPDAPVIDAYYQSLDTGLTSDCSWQTDAGHKRQLWIRLLDRVERQSGRGPVADLGCGGGQFLQLARSSGWTDLCGVEPSPKAAGIARAAVSVPIHEGTWKDITLDPGTFAAVALLDVLEHDRDPGGLLEHCLQLLRPGGSLLLTVPNIHGLSLRCFGVGAHVLVPPEHLSYFTAKSIRLMLLRSGFKGFHTFTCDLYLKEWLRFVPRGKESRGGTVTDEARKAHYLKWHQRLSGGIALAGIAGANTLLACAGCGDQLVVVAVKGKEPSSYA